MYIRIGKILRKNKAGMENIFMINKPCSYLILRDIQSFENSHSEIFFLRLRLTIKKEILSIYCFLKNKRDDEVTKEMKNLRINLDLWFGKNPFMIKNVETVNCRRIPDERMRLVMNLYFDLYRLQFKIELNIWFIELC
ncbi:hypothetical protein EDEG_04020 [Edhazardia aedis USNM 41457]|uniref:Uncharacterized protein n=1 Tax=Edhazardia aedis (strain USNM 41457) TaxID=1003232 RepID=J9D0C9_EDHAE|nr:hypothetical protein EDEG_04020 [Edhazardia aedis USNM 41457]|eukprot:EJW01331.1 hypothetical protein EDEG_04020 [Edhazardia aedis USNM 41457]